MKRVGILLEFNYEDLEVNVFVVQHRSLSHLTIIPYNFYPPKSEYIIGRVYCTGSSIRLPVTSYTESPTVIEVEMH